MWYKAPLDSVKESRGGFDSECGALWAIERVGLAVLVHTIGLSTKPNPYYR